MVWCLTLGVAVVESILYRLVFVGTTCIKILMQIIYPVNK